MNKLLLQQAGGFPLETDTLDFMQTAFSFLQGIASLGGDNYILQGCIKTGVNVGNGIVVIAGEVLEFRGGLEQTNIIIREEKQTRPFENGQVKDVFVTRYVTFGSGIDAIPFAGLSRLKTLDFFKTLPHETSNAIDLDDDTKLATAKAVKLLNDKVESKLPAGCILIWSGAINDIPAGFAFCNGSNNTPDLRDKFVLGAGNNYAVTDEGGEKEHVLTVNEMPKHSHGYKKRRSGSASGNADGHPDNTEDDASTTEVGGNKAHNNMPPYYALAYIIKL